MDHARKRTVVSKQMKNCVKWLSFLLVALTVVIGSANDAVSQESGEGDMGITGLELSGFFDIHADRLRESDNIFGLGPFELDLESPFNDRLSGSAAMVFEDGVAEIGVGFVDLHFFREGTSSSSPCGRIFTDPGFHVQIGQFDIPFGVDYLMYATPDRITISAPLMTEFVFDGGWTDIGVRMFKAHPWYNMTGYFVNGFDSGYAAGGRFGLRPLENPFSSHDIREAPLLEAGVSAVLDFDKESGSEYTFLGADMEANLSRVRFLAEYAVRDHRMADFRQNALYGQGSYECDRLSLVFFGRYDYYRETGGDAAGDPETTRITCGVNREILGVSMLKLEYQKYLENDHKLSGHDDVLAAQLVVTF